jgi:hypothetical protein
MITAAAKALFLKLLAVVAAIAAIFSAGVAGESFLGLAGVSCGIIAGNVGVKPFAQMATGNLLHSFNLVFGCLSGSKDNRQLLALIRTV